MPGFTRMVHVLPSSVIVGIAVAVFEVNRDGVARLATATAAAGATRFVLVSSLAAGGPSPDRTPLRGGEPAFSSPTTYALFDGLFEKGLLSYLTGDPVALDDLRARALTVAESIVR